MIVGVPKELKTHEYRVGLTPTSVREVTSHGHQVIVETGAGAGIGAADPAYEKAGARIVKDVFPEAELIVKEGGGHPWPTIHEEVAVMADWFDKQLAKK